MQEGIWGNGANPIPPCTEVDLYGKLCVELCIEDSQTSDRAP